MKIDENSLSEVSHSPNNIRWAQKHYLDSYIYNNLYIEKVGFDYKIEGDFDSLYGMNHDIFIMIDSEGHIINHKCDCRFHSHYNACGHVLAALYLFRDIDESELPYAVKHDNIRFEKHENALQYQQRQAEERMMEYHLLSGENILKQLKSINNNYIEQIIHSEYISKEKINLYFNIKYDENAYHFDLNIDIKIGKESAKKSYVVKDFRELLDHIENNKLYRYGKDLVLQHSLDMFSDFSKQAINIINNKYARYFYENYQRRYLPLFNETLDVMFDLLAQAPEENLIDTFFDEKKLSMKINVERVKLGYNLEIEHERLLMGNKYFYQFKKRTLTRYTLKNPKEFMVFYNSISDGFVISYENWQEFLSYVYGLFGDTISFDGDFEEVYTYEDNIEMYVDLDERGLNIDIYAYYDNLKQNLLSGDFDNELSMNGKSLLRVIGRYGHIEEDSLIIEFNEKNFEEVLENIIPRLDEHFTIYIGEKLKNFKKNATLNLDLNVRMENNLLEIDLNSIKYTPEEIKEILGSYKKKKKFHKLKNGQIIKLNFKELDEVNGIFDELNIKTSDLKDGKKIIPLHNAFKLSDQLKTTQVLGSSIDKDVNVFIKRFKEHKSERTTIHQRFDSVLKDYQKDGVEWLLSLNQYQFGGILADDMGLGKTLQVIALLESCPNNKTSIIITPASLMYNWEEELKKFHSTLNHCCIHGDKSERKEIIDRYQNYDILITTYDYLLRDIDLYNKCDFYYVVLDEAHYIKNRVAKKSQAIKTLNFETALALTGTPIENSLAELWSIFDFLMPNYLSNYATFRDKYEKKIIRESDQKQIDKLKRLVEPFILRRTKQEVLKYLPDKIEKTIYIDFYSKEEKLYLAKLSQVNNELHEYLAIEETNKILILKMLLELRQICCEPRLLYEDIKNRSSKLDACLELIEMLRNNKQPILLFSAFTKTLDLIETELSKMNLNYLKLTGSNSKKERQEMVNQFQKGDVAVFLISLKAGSVGLNLTKAQAVIHFDPWWNISAQNQATDRAYRIGQKNEVQVYSLIMKNSIEEKIIKLQQSKKAIADTFVENSKGSVTKMSTDDIIDLLKRD